MKTVLAALAVFSSLTMSVSAEAAAIISFDGKTSISGSNDFKSQLAGLGLTKYDTTGASIFLTENSVITFHLLGSESGFNDGFFTISDPNLMKGESSPFQNNFGSPVLIGSANFNAGSLTGLLNFSSIGGKPATVGQNGFAIFLGNKQKTGADLSTFYFGYDDQVTKADNDYDDMIIRATVTSAVPEPATWAMMLIGFGAIGGAMRVNRRKTKVAALAC
jgi:hypothetical protein